MANRDSPGLKQAVGISAHSSFIKETASHGSPGLLAWIDLRLNLKASLGRPTVLANSGHARLV